jgi:hypothetical protein
MISAEEELERRRLKRFQVRRGVFVILKPSDTGLGRLIDISMDGLTLEYISTQESKIKPTELEIFVTNGPFGLYEMPCRTISDFLIFRTNDGSLSKRRRGIQFGALTPSQVAQLEYFIKNHTTGEVQV